MPAPIDLTGASLGRLVVLGIVSGIHRNPRHWRVRCECGREEIYPQRRLTQNRPRRPAVRACTMCDAPECLECGRPIPDGRSSKRTCGSICALAHKRSRWRAYYRRSTADPARKERILARRRLERAALSPEEARSLDRRRISRRRELEQADPAMAEKRRQRARIRYAMRAEETQRRRREYLDVLTPDQLARWMDRAASYGRAYARRRREEIRSDPEAHRAYLDLMAEYRRRRSLAMLWAESASLHGGGDV